MTLQLSWTYRKQTTIVFSGDHQRFNMFKRLNENTH